ncbi:MAG TPA: helix-turn-helix domain-containing protein [Candidatus Binataceae bacterium]|nr:helix-turn-helix domain-containing protein [Candidatus Binataceae bacterium]
MGNPESSVKVEESLLKRETLADRIRQVLDERGLSQTQAAERAGIPLATLNKWINQSDKAPNPSADNLVALKQAFNVSIDWLLTAEGLREPIPSFLADVMTRLTKWLNSSIGSGALDPSRIDVVRPDGDAFLPEYGPNDLFVLERTSTLPGQDQICYISFGGMTGFRRVVHEMDGSVLLTAPNPATPPWRVSADELDTQIKVHGRVVGALKVFGRMD